MLTTSYAEQMVSLKSGNGRPDSSLEVPEMPWASREGVMDRRAPRSWPCTVTVTTLWSRKHHTDDIALKLFLMPSKSLNVWVLGPVIATGQWYPRIASRPVP